MGTKRCHELRGQTGCSSVLGSTEEQSRTREGRTSQQQIQEPLDFPATIKKQFSSSKVEPSVKNFKWDDMMHSILEILFRIKAGEPLGESIYI